MHLYSMDQLMSDMIRAKNECEHKHDELNQK